MTTIDDSMVDFELPRPRVGVLLDHFSERGDAREPERIMYPQSEVLNSGHLRDELLVLRFRRDRRMGRTSSRFPAQNLGTSFWQRWLRILVNRIDPTLLERCFDTGRKPLARADAIGGVAR